MNSKPTPSEDLIKQLMKDMNLSREQAEKMAQHMASQVGDVKGLQKSDPNIWSNRK